MASVARQHAEWLSLLEINGPFLSMAVLLDAFPQGLDAHDPEHAHLFRTFYEEWLESGNSHQADPAVHKAWIDFVLKETLRFTDEVLVSGQRIPENLAIHVARENETVRPSFVLLNPTSSKELGKARLLIDVLPRSQDVEKAMESRRWKASPASRMLELLKATNTRLGLVTNGEQWMLVSAASGEAAGFITWTANDCVEEPLTFRAFRSLLGLRRFFGVEDSKTIESLLNASLDDQQEVTDQLGYQVRKAVEVFIQAVDRIDQDSNRELLKDASPALLYEAALTVMMRFVFLLSAEERGLFLLGEEMYDQHYAVSTLRGQLRETADQYGEEVVSRRLDAWYRLVATFRAVYGGIENDALRFPAYGGSLFDPDRFPFLEGRLPGTHWRETLADPLPINNQIVLHLLEALQILRVKVPGGPPEARRLSFSGLGVEQIGHVYEGLLDYAALRATAPILGLMGSKNQESEIELAELEQLRERGETELLEHLKKVTGRQASTLKRALDVAADETQLSDQIESQRLLQACNNDTTLCERVRPFAKLLRLDTMNLPVVINEGSLYVTTGSERRSSGTYYTPPSLTEPIVKHALDPLVYIGPSEGLPETEWKLKSAEEILDLKVCDMAMGSGAFLVQVCRYLAEKLVEAWGYTEAKNPDAFIVTPEGELSTGSAAERLLPADADERILIARRYVADKCIYGVDKNDLAVNMAKLSLWLVTLQRDRPFTFLDHALKRGDSLLGVTSLSQIEDFGLRPAETQFTFATANLFRYVEEASQKRRELEGLPSNAPSQIEVKNCLFTEAEAATARVRAVADCIIALELRDPDRESYDKEREHEAERVQLAIERDAEAGIESSNPRSELTRTAGANLNGRRPFHWPVEFPEVFDRGGFDAFVGNPPFLGGSKITVAMGTDYRNYIQRFLAAGKKGKADLSVYFLLRGFSLLRSSGGIGLIITSSAGEGDAKDVGLAQIKDLMGGEIYRAEPNMNWPGSATVSIAKVWLRNGSFLGSHFIDGLPVTGITPALMPATKILREPQTLSVQSGVYFRGTEIKGLGFVLEETKAIELLARDPRNSEIIFPYLTGNDLNSTPDQSATRKVINFHDWPIDKARQYVECFAIVTEKVKPYRDTITKQIHEADYWKFWDKRLANYARIASLQRVLAISLVTNHVSFAFVPAVNVVYSHKIAIISSQSSEIFAVLQSGLQYVWAWTFSPKNLSLLAYSPAECIAKFPLPDRISFANNNDETTLRVRMVGENYQEYRRHAMISRNEGLTTTYNRFHDRRDQSIDIAHLRKLQVEMDQAVAAAYGWTDLDLGHGFQEIKQGIRFTLSESARREVLDRLVQLNQERYSQEERLGLHEKKRSKGSRRAKTVSVEEANTRQDQLQLSS